MFWRQDVQAVVVVGFSELVLIVTAVPPVVFVLATPAAVGGCVYAAAAVSGGRVLSAWRQAAVIGGITVSVCAADRDRRGLRRLPPVKTGRGTTERVIIIKGTGL